MAKLWAIFDLDGTVSDDRHRQSWAHAKDWDNYHARCGEDPPYMAELAIAQAWAHSGGVVAYNTARPETFRMLTLCWLKDHQFPKGPVFMRGASDRRPSIDVKWANMTTIEALLPRGDQIAFIMEDRDHLVAHWRQLGYTCLQPRKGSH